MARLMGGEFCCTLAGIGTKENVSNLRHFLFLCCTYNAFQVGKGNFMEKGHTSGQTAIATKV